MPDFIDQELQGSLFDGTDLRESTFRNVDLRDARFRGAELDRVVMRGVALVDVDIDGEIERLVINGVDVVPLIDAELDRRQPERAAMRPTDPDGFREAWDALERLWDGTVQRARRLDPGLLHESVDGEWSFIETLRHLAFATDCWISRAILGDPRPWHPLGLPCDDLPGFPGAACDRTARPSLDEALELRLGRASLVRRVLEELTDERLNAETGPVTGPGWPEPGRYPVRRCLQCILDEEWAHRLYAERDLAVLEARAAAAGR